MSSYELFVQLPMRPAETFSGHCSSCTVFLNWDRGVDRSGVCGPLMCGSSSERLISISWSYSAPSSALNLKYASSELPTPGKVWKILAALARSPLLVASRYLAEASVKGNTEVVAPTSALQYVNDPA